MFPEIRLRAAAVVPPTVLLVAPAAIKIPRESVPPASDLVPVASVPKKLPSTRFSLVPSMSTPAPCELPPALLLTSRLRASGVSPPTVLADEPDSIRTSSPAMFWTRCPRSWCR